MTITIRVVPPEQQRYKTVGDWPRDLSHPDGAEIIVSDTGDWRESICIAVHELMEAIVCKQQGITAAMVDADDALPLTEGYDEHGDMPTVRYHEAHDFAMTIERALAHKLGLDWKVYSDHIDAAYDRAPDVKP